jgi:hypothetical protein
VSGTPLPSNTFHILLSKRLLFAFVVAHGSEYKYKKASDGLFVCVVDFRRMKHVISFACLV